MKKGVASNPMRNMLNTDILRSPTPPATPNMPPPPQAPPTPIRGINQNRSMGMATGMPTSQDIINRGNALNLPASQWGTVSEPKQGNILRKSKKKKPKLSKTQTQKVVASEPQQKYKSRSGSSYIRS